jgi:drug/metabolite transporter (DMT)-like permease
MSPASAAVRPASWAVHAKLVGMAAMWGGSWPAGKLLAQNAPPFAGASWRFILALGLLLAWWTLRQRASGAALWPRLSARQWAGLALAGAVGVYGYAAFFMLGLQHVPAGRAALVVTVNPVFTTLIAAWLFRERFTPLIAAGMVLATLGASIVLTHGEPWRLLLGDIGVGEWLLLGCVAAWVAYTLLGRRLLVGIDALATTLITAAAGLVLLVASSLAFEGPAALAAPRTFNAEIWIALVFLAAGATVLAYAWYFEGVAALGAGGASAYISLVPVFGVASASLWLGEPIGPSLLIGGALAVGGMVVMNRARR